ILLTAATSFGANTNDLIAFFPLRSDAKDTLNQCPPIYLTNAPFVHGVLYLNGVYEYSAGTPKGFRVIASVPGLNYQSFTIGLDFFPLNRRRPRPLRAFEAKLNEWTRGYYRRWVADCLSRPVPPENFLTGGAGFRWLGFNPGTNGLELTLNNQTFRHQFKGAI